MVRLDSGNVLLKPSHRRQLLGSLKRSLRLGERLGDFQLDIQMNRTKRQYEMQARVHDAVGDFACRSRGGDLRGVQRNLIQSICDRLHDQCVHRLRVA